MNFTNIETLKSVMVWIYGGGFQIGTAHQGIYGPDFILEEDVVFVSLNYRLGALGTDKYHEKTKQVSRAAKNKRYLRKRTSRSWS